MHPRARRDVAADFHDPILAAVFHAADGSRSVAAMADLIGQDEETVFAALDQLADDGLLEERVAPPSASRRFSRRGLLGGVGLAAAGLAAVILPRRAEARGEEIEKKSPAARGEQIEKKSAAARGEEIEKKSAAPRGEHKVKSTATEQKQKKAASPRDEQLIKRGAHAGPGKGAARGEQVKKASAGEQRKKASAARKEQDEK